MQRQPSGTSDLRIGILKSSSGSRSQLLEKSSASRNAEKKSSLLIPNQEVSFQKDSLLIDEKEPSVGFLAPPDPEEEGDLPSMNNTEALVS